MKVIIFAALFVAAVSGKAAPISHSLEVSTTGEVGSSVLSPLVSLLINMSHGLSHLVSIEGLPAQTPAVVSPTPAEIPDPVAPIVVPGIPEVPVVVPAPESPAVVDTPTIPETPIVVPAPETPTVVDTPNVPETPIVVPAPESPAVVDTPTIPESPIVVDPENPAGVIVPGFEIESPVVVPAPETPTVVDTPNVPETPIVVPAPESPAVVDTPTIPESPIVVAPENPAGVIVPGFEIESPVVVPAPESPIVVDTPAVPETPIVVEQPAIPGSPVVVDGPEAVSVIEGAEVSPVIAPEEVETPAGGITNNFLINVLLNFIMGKDGNTSVTTSGLPDASSLPQGLQQLLAAAGPTPRG